MNQAATLEAVRTWPMEQRVELVFRLWDELVGDQWRPEPSDELNAELDRRLDAHEVDPANVRTWEQIVNCARRRS